MKLPSLVAAVPRCTAPASPPASASGGVGAAVNYEKAATIEGWTFAEQGGWATPANRVTINQAAGGHCIHGNKFWSHCRKRDGTGTGLYSCCPLIEGGSYQCKFDGDNDKCVCEKYVP